MERLKRQQWRAMEERGLGHCREGRLYPWGLSVWEPGTHEVKGTTKASWYRHCSNKHSLLGAVMWSFLGSLSLCSWQPKGKIPTQAQLGEPRSWLQSLTEMGKGLLRGVQAVDRQLHHWRASPASPPAFVYYLYMSPFSSPICLPLLFFSFYPSLFSVNAQPVSCFFFPLGILELYKVNTNLLYERYGLQKGFRLQAL